MYPPPIPSSCSQSTALCYTRTASNVDALKQQMAIEAVCQQQGWLPEWYQDVDTRSAWQILVTRLSEPDVAALVVCDLDRISRKFDEIVVLLDQLADYHLQLALAGPGGAIYSTSALQGFSANREVFEQWYATDIQRRVKQSIAFRRQSKT